MIECCSCFQRKKEPEIQLSESGKMEMEYLATLIHHRAHELTEMIIQGPLNMKQLPDFMERRVLETIITMAFTAIVTILLPPEHERHRTRKNRARTNQIESNL